MPRKGTLPRKLLDTVTGLIQIKASQPKSWHDAFMTTKTLRKIVHIDEEKCNGCGECIPSCAEGAIRIVNGKARLVADNLCDGLGACLGHCPMDAIRVEEREAEGFDEEAVERHLAARHHPPVQQMHAHGHAGCPGSRLKVMQPQDSAPAQRPGSSRARLNQWPVQLALLPPGGPLWQDADVLIAADCVPFAYPDFHERMLAGKRLAIACPKLDDVRPYVQKLAGIFAGGVRSVTVAHMEVPCCTGILRLVQMAVAEAGRDNIPVQSVIVGTDGTIRE